MFPPIKKLLLVGNGSYQNRGCEAILQGTLRILQKEFGASLEVVAGVFEDEDAIEGESPATKNPPTHSFGLQFGGPRGSLLWWQMQVNKRFGTVFTAQHLPILRHIDGTSAALELGGDNYSLDYGRPTAFLSMDRFLQRKEVPVVIWGASVGPFDADPEFARIILNHLKGIEGIFVRETASRAYLREHGIEQNVYLVADPAFAMAAVKPAEHKIGFPIPPGAVGVNLSPVVGRYFCERSCRESRTAQYDRSKWASFCAAAVQMIADTADRAVVLVPHVGASAAHNDDFSFLEAVQRLCADTVGPPVLCLRRGLNAAETKWAIAQCDLFVGSRTHSTIASISSCVPTLSIGYSLKAKGINQDVFGSGEFCIGAEQLHISGLKKNLQHLMQRQDAVRLLLHRRIPDIIGEAFKAGPLLRKVLARN